MSMINGLGQGVYTYFQSAKLASAHEIATPVTESDADGDGNAGTSGGNRKDNDKFGLALLATLAKHLVSVEDFQRDFLAEMHRLNGGTDYAPISQTPFSAVG